MSHYKHTTQCTVHRITSVYLLLLLKLMLKGQLCCSTAVYVGLYGFLLCITFTSTTEAVFVYDESKYSGTQSSTVIKYYWHCNLSIQHQQVLQRSHKEIWLNSLDSPVVIHYSNSQTSTSWMKKSSFFDSVSLLKVLQKWLRPWYRSSSNHKPNCPLPPPIASESISPLMKNRLSPVHL